MRGYAYQDSYPTTGISIFPSLTSLEPPQYLTVQGQLYTQAIFTLLLAAFSASTSIDTGNFKPCALFAAHYVTKRLHKLL